jgi:hypothetical protein
MSELNALYHNIADIYTSPISYIKTVEKKTQDSMESIQSQFLQIFLNKKSIDKNIISMCKEFLNTIFTSIDMKINYKGFESYLKKYVKLPKTACSKFIDNSDICENIKDDIPIPIEILFAGMSCKHCALFQEAHKICSKYSSINNDDCDTCGMSKYKHQVCNKFIKQESGEECFTCGRDIHTHQEKELESGIFPCDNFVETNGEDCYECKNCIHSRTYHMFNPILFKMNKKAFNEFTSLAFEFNADFIGQTQTEMSKNRNLLMYVMRMNYGKAHPAYAEFSKFIVTQV